MTSRRTVIALAAVLLVACEKPLPAPDPTGHDLVEGAVVAAATSAETTPGMRMYKVVKVDDLPAPVGWTLHLLVYDPKAPTFEDARRLQRGGKLKVLSDHIEVRLSDFITRDHRVLVVEPVSEADLKGYIRARDHKASELFPRK